MSYEFVPITYITVSFLTGSVFPLEKMTSTLAGGARVKTYTVSISVIQWNVTHLTVTARTLLK